MTDTQALINGYNMVKDGMISRELSTKEIEKYYHECRNHAQAFANGIIDALHYDDTRYNMAHLNNHQSNS